jgi:hypothetical protein
MACPKLPAICKTMLPKRRMRRQSWCSREPVQREQRKIQPDHLTRLELLLIGGRDTKWRRKSRMVLSLA